jgi:DNA-3-methyladenine glycosylase II
MRRDRIMKKLIPRFGDLQLVGRGDPFMTLGAFHRWTADFC